MHTLLPAAAAVVLTPAVMQACHLAFANHKRHRSACFARAITHRHRHCTRRTDARGAKRHCQRTAHACICRAHAYIAAAATGGASHHRLPHSQHHCCQHRCSHRHSRHRCSHLRLHSQNHMHRQMHHRSAATRYRRAPRTTHSIARPATRTAVGRTHRQPSETVTLQHLSPVTDISATQTLITPRPAGQNPQMHGRFSPNGAGLDIADLGTRGRGTNYSVAVADLQKHAKHEEKHSAGGVMRKTEWGSLPWVQMCRTPDKATNRNVLTIADKSGRRRQHISKQHRAIFLNERRNANIGLPSGQSYVPIVRTAADRRSKSHPLEGSRPRASILRGTIGCEINPTAPEKIGIPAEQ